MPPSDIALAIIGALDFASIFVVIIWTGFVSRKDAATANKQKDCEVRK
jgi:hypothetical protein